MNARILATLILLALPNWSLAQGFEGLGQQIAGFASADPDTRFSFPTDHGVHEEFRVEWWYVTANLTGSDGRDYGAQWTLFRAALSPDQRDGFQSPVVWLGHAALTTPDAHFAAERYARGGIGQAGVTPEPFEAWIDSWALSGPTLNRVNMSVQTPDFKYDLSLLSEQSFVLQGVEGYSVKSEQGDASHYYSQPFYEVSGTVETAAASVEVTGEAWLDREWFSSILTEAQSGWDWTALHLSDGSKLMAAQIRGTDGGTFGAATWISPKGTPTPYPNGAAIFTPLATTRIAGRDVPTHWRLEMPVRDLDIEIEAVYPRAWNNLSVPYWEGPVRVTGTHLGRGYLEMTGYE